MEGKPTLAKAKLIKEARELATELSKQIFGVVELS